MSKNFVELGWSRQRRGTVSGCGGVVFGGVKGQRSKAVNYMQGWGKMVGNCQLPTPATTVIAVNNGDASGKARQLHYFRTISISN